MITSLFSNPFATSRLSALDQIMMQHAALNMMLEAATQQRPISKLAQALNDKAGFSSHPSGLDSVALNKKGEIDSKETANKLLEAGVIHKNDKRVVRDMLDGKGKFKDIPPQERIQMYNESLHKGSFRMDSAEFLNKHKGMQSQFVDGQKFNSVSLNENGEVDAKGTAKKLAANGFINKKDRGRVEDLLDGTGSAKNLSPEVRSDLYNRIIQDNNGVAGEELHLKNAMKMADKLSKGGENRKLDTYLQQIGARPATPNFGDDGTIKNTKIAGVEPGFDMSRFSEYTITAKDADGKKIKIKVDKEAALEDGFQPGKLRGIDSALKKAGVSDLSELKDVKIEGRLDNGKKYKVNEKKMNQIANGEKTFEDFEVKKRGFFGRLFGGIKDVFSGVGKVVKGAFDVISAPIKGIVNTIGGTIGALASGKNLFDAIGDGFANGAKSAVNSITGGLSSAVGGVAKIASSGLRMVSEKAGDFLEKGISTVGNFAVEMVASPLRSASAFVSTLNDISDGRGGFGKNMLSLLSNGLDVALTFAPGGAGVRAATTAAKAVKTVDKAADAAKAVRAADKAADAAQAAKAAEKAANAQKAAQAADKAADAQKATEKAKLWEKTISIKHDAVPGKELYVNPTIASLKLTNMLTKDQLQNIQSQEQLDQLMLLQMQMQAQNNPNQNSSSGFYIN